MRLFSSILDILFPEYCVGCGKSGQSICPECISLLPHTDSLPEDWMHAVFSYRSPLIRSLIHTLKYKGNMMVLAPLSKELAKEFMLFLNEDIRAYTYIVLIPVPSPKKRVRERGYTQSHIVAKILQKELKDPKISIREVIQTKNHESQVNTKSRDERLRNIQGVFFTEEYLNKDTLYVIIDDVITTGATMKEIKSVLENNGASNILGFTVAH